MIKELITDKSFLDERAMEWDVRKEQELSTELVQNLSDTLKSLPNRYYLCSNEIGYHERAFAIKFSDEIKIFMNPIFQSKGNLKLVRELDPLTNKEYIIPRYTDVTVCYQNCMGKIEANKFNEQASVVVSQAMDCLEGVHSSDYGLEVIPEFDLATEEEREEVINAYLESIKKTRDELDRDLQEDEETKEEWNYYRFVRDKNEGKIETVDLEEQPKFNRKQRRLLDKLIKKFKRRKK